MEGKRREGIEKGSNREEMESEGKGTLRGERPTDKGETGGREPAKQG